MQKVELIVCFLILVELEDSAGSTENDERVRMKSKGGASNAGVAAYEGK